MGITLWQKGEEIPNIFLQETARHSCCLIAGWQVFAKAQTNSCLTDGQQSFFVGKVCPLGWTVSFLCILSDMVIHWKASNSWGKYLYSIINFPFQARRACVKVLAMSYLLICTPVPPCDKDLHLLNVDMSNRHFAVVCLVTWPLNGSEAGVDLALIQTSLLLSCKST